MHFKEVKDPELWQKIQFTMIEAMTIFVFTILIGITNALNLFDENQSYELGGQQVLREFTRAELLFHLHSGAIGWLSLSSIAILVWYFTGDRDLDEDGLRMANNLLRYVQIVIPVYVIFFYLGFTLADGDEVLRLFTIGKGGDGWFILLVVGAIGAVIAFLWTLYFGITELLKLEVKTTPHYLFLGAMLTSSYGGLFGMILEIQNLLNTSFYDTDAGQSGGAAHAAAMEAGYLYMMIAAIVEWQVFGQDLGEMPLSGRIQTAALFFAGLAISLGAGFNILPLAALNLPLLLLGFGLLVYRVFLKVNPRSLIGTEPDRFFIPVGISMTYSVFFFLYVVYQIVGLEKDANALFESPWIVGLALANNHGLFIGAMTGVIFTIMMVMFKDASETGKRVENIGFILMYLGVLLFMIVLIVRGNAQENDDADFSDLGTEVAAIMGIGLYMIMGVLFARYRKVNSTIHKGYRKAEE